MHLKAAPPRDFDTTAGTAIYSSFVLRLYDAWVLGFSNRWAWQCPTNNVLLPFYRKHVGKRHLDVGVGTGYYLAHAGFRDQHAIALLDLNENSLHKAAQRLRRSDADLFVQDVMQPLTALHGRQYDSIALFYLLHCLPGNMTDKARVFANFSRHLSAEGVLYGATILGNEADHNGLGRRLMEVYNRKGIFSNSEDTFEALNNSLNQHFGQVTISQHGKVALFAAHRPRSFV